MKPVCSANGMNCDRRHQAALRVLPAHQRLGADQPAARQRDLRLQVEAQLVALDGLAQLGQQRQRLRAGASIAGRRPAAPLRAALGGVHRDLGAVEQRVGVVGVLRPAGDADARARCRPCAPRATQRRIERRARPAARPRAPSADVAAAQQHARTRRRRGARPCRSAPHRAALQRSATAASSRSPKW